MVRQLLTLKCPICCLSLPTKYGDYHQLKIIHSFWYVYLVTVIIHQQSLTKYNQNYKSILSHYTSGIVAGLNADNKSPMTGIPLCLKALVGIDLGRGLCLVL